MQRQMEATERTRRPRVLFVGITYAGWQTRQLNLEAHTRHDWRIEAIHRRVTGWREGGIPERLPLPRGLRGRVRALAEAAPFARIPRPDAIWTSVPELIVPYLWAQAGPLRRPLVVETDWSLAQQEELAPIYFDRPPRTGARRLLAEWQEQALVRATTLFAPLSSWAADGLRRAGVPDDRIRVLHPGVDLGRWPAPRREPPIGRKLRLLFVGGDFGRKGGPMLVDLVRTRFADRCELDLVTRAEVRPSPGIRVHRCEPNSPELLARFAAADLFVLPTRAECFGIATVEAMASGLPTIAGDVGGARDIVAPGETGWLIEPRPAALAAALEAALADPAALPAMGQAGRRTAERKFDGVENDRTLVSWLVELAARRGCPLASAGRALEESQ